MDQICDGQLINIDGAPGHHFDLRKQKCSLKNQASIIILEGDILEDIGKEDEYNIKITKYDNSFTHNLWALISEPF